MITKISILQKKSELVTNWAGLDNSWIVQTRTGNPTISLSLDKLQSNLDKSFIQELINSAKRFCLKHNLISTENWNLDLRQNLFQLKVGK